MNPVAAARFFDFITLAFIKHILGVGSDHDGIYGETDAYYGTVEQQGRLTLHMHMLIWIKCALSPQEIRDRILDPNGEFQKAMIDYLESCQVGQFLTGNMSDVRAKVPIVKRSRGIHEINEPVPVVEVPAGYKDPTQTMPVAPPPLCEKACESPSSRWWSLYAETVDDLLLRSNGTDLSKPIVAGSKIKIPDGTCSARFPREVHLTTEVDVTDGSISVKKLEPMINTVTPALTYSLRLLSGTAIKAPSLKLYHTFDAHTMALNMSASSELNGKLLVTQMMQIGSPMASMYLLGHPDHYTNLTFKVCWWKSYVSVVNKAWPDPDTIKDATYVRDGIAEDEVEDESHHAVLMRSSKEIVGATAVDDYMHRPNEYSQCSAYEYIQVSTRCKRTPKQLAEFLESLDERCEDGDAESDEDESWLEHDLPWNAGREALDELRSYAFRKEHPLWRTHYIRCDRRNLSHTVPNFIGGSLPRKDQGDRELYCKTMLTLFKSWRDGKDLKTEEESWNDAFTRHIFSDDEIRIMKNLNLRYECNDARDDYSSLDKSRKNSFSLLTSLEDSNEDAEVEVDSEQAETDFKAFLKEISPLRGPKQISKDAQIGWTVELAKAPTIAPAVFAPRLLGKTWKKRQEVLKNELFASKFKHAPPNLKTVRGGIPGGHVEGVTVLTPSYFTKDFVAKQVEASALLADTISAFSLNTEQERAFRIIANHSLDETAPVLHFWCWVLRAHLLLCLVEAPTTPF
ncbi:hypothetical protein C8R45DRAFT_1055418 [Mycena sanguinolenta]|nr:hypothetical protein C8R45DRAFT_1055418 [Mycena sanguinolenta]